MDNFNKRVLVLNKLYDKSERNTKEIDTLFKEIQSFANKNNLECNNLKWFEYGYSLLYSGHRFRGKVLDIGSAKSVFPYYLASKDYDVSCIDIADREYREMMGKKFNVKSLTGDLQQFLPELENKFDLITNLSVIEHIPNDTQTVLNLAKYLKSGGIMVISTDFYEKYLEYPDANRIIVADRPAGSHTDSRVYTPDTFMERIITPLEENGMKRLGSTDFNNVDINDRSQRSVRGLYTFGLSILRKE